MMLPKIGRVGGAGRIPTGGWCQGCAKTLCHSRVCVPRPGSPLHSLGGSLTGCPVGSCLTWWSLPWCGMSQLLYTCTHTCVHIHCTCMCRYVHTPPHSDHSASSARLGTPDPTPVGFEAGRYPDTAHIVALSPCVTTTGGPA